MYSELYAAWKAEIENSAIQPLPADFYARVSDYLQRIKIESRAADKNNVKTTLLEREQRNVNRIVKELLRTRYKKLLRTVNGGQKLLPEILTTEEAELFNGLLPFTEAYRAFARGFLQGKPLKTEVETAETKEKEAEAPHKRVALRFLKPVPAIIGSDMKTYGPFVAEDVASVPVENAKILTKQGFAEPIEVS
jgi:DNA replication factor GINS